MVALLAAKPDSVALTTMRSTLRRTRSAASSGKRSSFPSGKSILDGDVLSFYLAKLAQRLPSCLDKD